MKSSITFKIAGHVVVWLLFFTLILSISTSMGHASFAQELFSFNFYFFCLVYLFIFYINSIILFPNFYLQKKYFIYFLFILVLGTAVFYLTPFDNLLRPEQANMPRQISTPPGGLRPPALHDNHKGLRGGRGVFIDSTSLILFLLVWLASMYLQILKQWRTSQQRALVAESDKKTAELAFLKAHINPHFLFNTLNNIYALATVGHEQTAPSILKLSNIMRYVTESVAVDFILLENELESIVDYVDLQKLRLNNKVYLDFSITGNADGKVIAPLMLMTFIENIFKYGISNHHQSTMTIKIFIEKDAITFYSQNRIFNPDFVYDRKGVGITNTKRRLEFLYPNKHSLDIHTEKGLYTVQLILQTG